MRVGGKTTEKTELCVQGGNRSHVPLPEGTLKGQGEVGFPVFQASWDELWKLTARKLGV